MLKKQLAESLNANKPDSKAGSKGMTAMRYQFLTAGRQCLVKRKARDRAAAAGRLIAIDGNQQRGTMKFVGQSSSHYANDTGVPIGAGQHNCRIRLTVC